MATPQNMIEDNYWLDKAAVVTGGARGQGASIADGRQRTADGWTLCALRKQIPEPVFGIIRSVMGFRRFLPRGLDRVRGEWSFVTLAWNMKRMFVLRPV